MKNKKITYLLLTVVAAIWGVVIRNIVTFSKPEAPPAIIGSMSQSPVMEIAEDKLLLDYRDPFLGKTSAPKESIKPVAVPVSAPPPVPEKIPFAYKGIIRKGKEVYALLESSGSQEAVTRGSQAGEFTVTLITEDSLVLRKTGKNYTLKLR